MTGLRFKTTCRIALVFFLIMIVLIAVLLTSTMRTLFRAERHTLKAVARGIHEELRAAGLDGQVRRLEAALADRDRELQKAAERLRISDAAIRERLFNWRRCGTWPRERTVSRRRTEASFASRCACWMKYTVPRGGGG